MSVRVVKFVIFETRLGGPILFERIEKLYFSKITVTIDKSTLSLLDTFIHLFNGYNSYFPNTYLLKMYI